MKERRLLLIESRALRHQLKIGMQFFYLGAEVLAHAKSCAVHANDIQKRVDSGKIYVLKNTRSKFFSSNNTAKHFAFGVHEYDFSRIQIAGEIVIQDFKRGILGSKNMLGPKATVPRAPDQRPDAMRTAKSKKTLTGDNTDNSVTTPGFVVYVFYSVTN